MKFNNVDTILVGFFTVPGSRIGSAILSDSSFEALSESVNDLTLRAIKDMGFTHMTQIQTKSIPPLLEGKTLRFGLIQQFLLFRRSFVEQRGNVDKLGVIDGRSLRDFIFSVLNFHFVNDKCVLSYLPIELTDPNTMK